MLRNKLKELVPQSLRKGLHQTKAMTLLAWRDIRYDILGQVLPMKPKAISFMANDICNSRCTMCLIWERKRDKELSIDEFRQLLDEPLFSKVQHIGITGGEPTLRKDLPELFRVIAERVPKIIGASIITNGIKEKEVTEKILESYEICKDKGIEFNVMVSLDGLGEIHDINRGKPGNFVTVVNCIKEFKGAGIETSIGCTITKDNVLYIDELLDWANENNVYARFRVAEFIDRLYNSNQTEYIRNFSEIERHHLGLFFHRLNTYEPNSMIRKTYASILGMVTEGKKRSTGCPYHTDTVILTTRAELLYCAPKSPVLGTILVPGSSSKVYFGNLNKRQEIKKKFCDDCIHDYHVPVSFREQVNFFLKCRHINSTYNCSSLIKYSARIQRHKEIKIVPECLNSRSVLIVGWYGTETVGDKAILWSIVHRLRARAKPPNEINITSFNPWYTENTIKELGLNDIKIVETYSNNFERACKKVDEIVMAGGPLMDLESLNHILYAFHKAAQRYAVTRIEGCGIGPLSKPIYISMVNEILRLSCHTTLRDSVSVQRAQNQFKIDAELVNDPAEDYIKKYMIDNNIKVNKFYDTKKLTANLFLRQLPRQYAVNCNDDEFNNLSQHFEKELLSFMEHLVTQKGYHLKLLPMCTISDGGDDRAINRRIVKKLLERNIVSHEQVQFTRVPLAPNDIIKEMIEANLNICMRYHSVMFAESLGKKFIAIDYTEGGKIYEYLSDRGKEDHIITLGDFAAGNWQHKYAMY